MPIKNSRRWRLLLVFFIFLTGLFLWNRVALAQVTDAKEFERDIGFGIIPCPNYDPACIVNSFLTIALSIVGGLAFLLLILGAYRVLTSTGNPEALNEARGIIIA